MILRHKMTFSQWDKLPADKQAMYLALDEAKQSDIQAAREQLSNHTDDKGEPQSLLTPEAWVMLKLAEMGL